MIQSALLGLQLNAEYVADQLFTRVVSRVLTSWEARREPPGQGLLLWRRIGVITQPGAVGAPEQPRNGMGAAGLIEFLLSLPLPYHWLPGGHSQGRRCSGQGHGVGTDF
jgi:hypothetical protein